MIFPVGHYLGARYPDGDHIVRIGWETYRLADDWHFGVWALAHGLPEGRDMAPWTREALEGAARATGISDAPRIVEVLLGKDLIVDIGPGADDAVEFARACRIQSLLVGVGNSAAEPLLFGIGPIDGKPVLEVPAFTYELWKWGHGCDSLWHAGRVFARADAAGAGPEQMVARCLSAAQVLIAHGAAYLDEARDGYPDDPGRAPGPHR